MGLSTQLDCRGEIEFEEGKGTKRGGSDRKRAFFAAWFVWAPLKFFALPIGKAVIGPGTLGHGADKRGLKVQPAEAFLDLAVSRCGFGRSAKQTKHHTCDQCRPWDIRWLKQGNLRVIARGPLELKTGIAMRLSVWNARNVLGRDAGWRAPIAR